MKAGSDVDLSSVFMATSSACGLGCDTYDCLWYKRLNGDLVLGQPKNDMDLAVNLCISTMTATSAYERTTNDTSSIRSLVHATKR